MVRVSILPMILSVVFVLSVVNDPSCEARPSPLQRLDGADLTDLLDAPLDETFLQRDLQEVTVAPTPAPDDFSTSTPTSVDRGLGSAGPTPSPVSFDSLAPTEVVTAAPTSADTSGAMGMGPTAAYVAVAATVFVATAVMA